MNASSLSGWRWTLKVCPGCWMPQCRHSWLLPVPGQNTKFIVARSPSAVTCPVPPKPLSWVSSFHSEEKTAGSPPGMRPSASGVRHTYATMPSSSAVRVRARPVGAYAESARPTGRVSAPTWAVPEPLKTTVVFSSSALDSGVKDSPGPTRTTCSVT